MRVLVLLNVSSGTGSDAGIYDFMRALGLAGAEVTFRFIGTGVPLESLVRDASDFDRIVAAGGDGTVSSVAYATRSAGVPLLAYPAGTANLFALNLGMPVDPFTIAEVATGDTMAALDLGEITFNTGGGEIKRGFLNAAGAGFDADIMRSAATLKPALGAAAYLVGAVQNLAPQPAQFHLTIDGDEITTDGIAVLIVNVGRLQFDLPLTGTSDPSDGVFEVAVLRSRNIARLLPAFVSAMLDRMEEYVERSQAIDIYSARKIRVAAEPPLPMQYDGEATDAVTPFEARLLPCAVRFLVPDGSPVLNGKTSS